MAAWDDELQYEGCKRRAANSMLMAAHELMEALSWIPDAEEAEHFSNLSAFLRQEADSLFPSGEKKEGKIIQFPGGKLGRG